MKEPTKHPDATRETVRNAYANIASGRTGSCCGSNASCCGTPDPEALARHIGYSEDELAALPEGANMGLSCGNPTAVASLKPGEIVLDLGSGGGFDVFVAARKVGASGRAIGVDMTPEMLTKARSNAIAFQEQTGLNNVDFRLGEIEHLPVPDGSVDVVISNCVINLSPDKPQVWREIHRVLKPGGRVAVSDLALRKPLPAELRESVEALVGCIAGAVLIEDTRDMATEAGFEDICCEPKEEAIEAMVDSNDPLYAKVVSILPPGLRVSDYVVSLYVTARKAPGCCCGCAKTGGTI
jgi:SAM-dependent methyltransferase